MSISETREFFDEYVPRRVLGKIDRVLIHNEIDSIHRALINRNGKLLEVGCGDGMFTKEIAKRRKDFSIVGIDISLQSVKLAKRESLPNVDYVVCDLNHLPIVSRAFDTVIAINVLHHVGSRTLESISNVLKTNGIVFISDHVVENPLMFVIRKGFQHLPRALKSLRTDASKEGEVPPIFLYSVPWLKNSLNACGFQLVYSEHFEIFATVWAGAVHTLFRNSYNLQEKLFRIWEILDSSEERLLRRIELLRKMGYRVRVVAVLRNNLS